MRRAAAILGITLMSMIFPANEPPKTGVQPRTYVSALDATEQPYNLYMPTTYDASKPMPLVVALHGKGATWQSWFAALPVEEWAEKEGFIVATPHGRGDWFYLGQGERDVFEVIADVKKSYTVDTDRLYLLGHSMGGFGAWHVAASHPDVFAAVVPMATWPPATLIPNLRHTPVLLIHGDADPVVPVEWGRRGLRKLEEHGIEHRWIAVPGLGHESALITAYLPSIGEFIRDRRLVHDPAQVSLRAYTPRRGKAWWVALHEVREFTSLASIDALIGPRRIDIMTFNVVDFAIDPPLGAERLAKPIQLSVDNQLLEVPPSHGERIIFLREVAGKWSARLAERDTFIAPKPKPVGNLVHEVPLPETVARIVARRVDADAVMLPNDLIAPTLPAGSIDEDQLLDIFLRPEDEICIVEVDAAQVEDLLVRKDWYPAWWGGLTLAPTPAKGNVVLAVPRILADRMPIAVQGTGLGIRRVVFDHVRTTGHLAPPPDSTQ
jgi:acetyl esterase/lipase